MAWFFLGVAVVFEVAWAIAMKLSAGLTKPGAVVLMGVAYVLSAVFLALATRTLSVGTAYAVWVGAGTVFIATIGVVYLGEPRSTLKLISLGLVVAGVVGLKLSEPPKKPLAAAAR